mmetsp:Transcript_45361/g.176228  ORF Transcript_45361/g.176228 Transcript_45361/m.176228 type:complete len:101 (-) Transcript_45361:350-652(-)
MVFYPHGIDIDLFTDLLPPSCSQELQISGIQIRKILIFHCFRFRALHDVGYSAPPGLCPSVIGFGGMSVSINARDSNYSQSGGFCQKKMVSTQRVSHLPE